MELQNTSFLEACQGRRPARTPVWIMRQAGRYLPEYREIRRKVSFEELCRTPELCAEVTLQPLDRFDLDAAILFSDILVVSDALGVEVRFAPGPTVTNPIRNGSDLQRLQFGEVDEELGYVFDAVRACKRALSGRVPLIGFCGGPLTTASYLIEGGSSSDLHRTKSFMWTEPVAFGRLLDSLTGVLCEYLEGQVRAGVDALQIFESWAGALAPSDYVEFVLPHMQRLCAHARDLGVPVIAFARGNAGLLEHIASLVPDGGGGVVGIDWGIDLDEAIEIVGSAKVVQGNLDPVALRTTPEVVTRRAERVLEHGRLARAHIFNLGHGISKETDPGMVQHLVEVVHSA